jgi:AGCS family alanine or glycine:cation symporter
MKKDPVLPEILKDCLITVGILSVASIICVILHQFSSTDTHVPMLFVLAVLSVRTKFHPQRRLGLSLRYAVTNEEGAEGDVTSFGALTTALAATVGTGNIVGVSTAIMAGGPGALSGVVAKETFDFWRRRESGEYNDGLEAAKAAKKAAKGK